MRRTELDSSFWGKYPRGKRKQNNFTKYFSSARWSVFVQQLLWYTVCIQITSKFHIGPGNMKKRTSIFILISVLTLKSRNLHHIGTDMNHATSQPREKKLPQQIKLWNIYKGFSLKIINNHVACFRPLGWNRPLAWQ